jgi:hypothetical protein
LILTEDLEMRKICAKIVPKLLTPEQKLWRKQCSIDWKALEERDAFLERVIIDGDDDYSRINNVAQRLEGRWLWRVFQPMEMRWDKCNASEGDKNDVPNNM